MLFHRVRFGQTRRFDLLSVTSGLPPTADVSGPGWHLTFVPRPDISHTAKTVDHIDRTAFVESLLVSLAELGPSESTM